MSIWTLIVIGSIAYFSFKLKLYRHLDKLGFTSDYLGSWIKRISANTGVSEYNLIDEAIRVLIENTRTQNACKVFDTDSAQHVLALKFKALDTDVMWCVYLDEDQHVIEYSEWADRWCKDFVDCRTSLLSDCIRYEVHSVLFLHWRKNGELEATEKEEEKQTQLREAFDAIGIKVLEHRYL